MHQGAGHRRGVLMD